MSAAGPTPDDRRSTTLVTHADRPVATSAPRGGIATVWDCSTRVHDALTVSSNNSLHCALYLGWASPNLKSQAESSGSQDPKTTVCVVKMFALLTFVKIPATSGLWLNATLSTCVPSDCW